MAKNPKSPNWGGVRPNSGRKLLSLDGEAMKQYLRERVLVRMSATGKTALDTLEAIMNDEEAQNRDRALAAKVVLDHELSAISLTLPKQREVDITVRDQRRGLSVKELMQQMADRFQQLQQLDPSFRIPVIEGVSERVSNGTHESKRD